MAENNNSNLESILSSNNNSVDMKSLEKIATGNPEQWLKRSVVNRSLFLDNISEIITLLFPKHMEAFVLNPDPDAISPNDMKLYIQNQKMIRNLKILYTTEVNTETIKQFISIMQNIIHIANGDKYDGRSWRKQGGCLYTGNQPLPVQGGVTCKKPSLDIRTTKFIDIISNTILLYFKKVSRTKKDLLENKNFIKVIGDLTDLLALIYYFTGTNYSGNRLCNRFSNLVRNINSIFGYSIIVQTGKNGKHMCGHGIAHVTKDDIHLIAVHEGKEDDGSIDVASLRELGYAVGGTRKRKNNKKNTRKSKYSR